MCGIAGIVELNGALASEAAVDVMADAIRHRGPDDEGFFVDGNVALASRRLAILDLSPRGRQPMWNEDGSFAVVHNGEVYNFAEIRRELESRGHVFRSHTDTEVILHAYETWGPECLHKFNGMWAVAIYDRRNRQLFLARDRFGVKPLYYYRDDRRFLFCSEIKGLLTQGIAREADDTAIFDYLIYNLLDHDVRTFFRGIRRLLPGHAMILDVQTGTQDIRRWYALEPRPASGDDRFLLKDLFADSVRLRLVADVPVGSCLSGGIDSSSIVCMMRQLVPEHTIKTFSAVFPGTGVDESRYVRAVVEQARVHSYRVTPTPEELVADLPDLIRAQEEPILSTSPYAQYRVMKLAHENGMKVLLDGQGGDELFAGYDGYLGVYFRELFLSGRWRALLREGALYARHARKTIPFQVAVYLLLPRAIGRAVRRIWFAPWLDRDFWTARCDTQDRDTALRRCRTLNARLKESIEISSIPLLLRYEDKNAMRWSVESRVPFLDYRLVEYSLSLPSERKICDGITKRAFRDALADLLPEAVQARRDKIGFATPEEEWLRAPAVVAFVRDLIASHAFRARGYWNADRFCRFFEGALRGGRGGKARQVWKVVFLELWFREILAPSASSHCSPSASLGRLHAAAITPPPHREGQGTSGS